MRAINKLTAASVKALVEAKKPGLHSDGAGLGLRIGPSGSASWVLRYQRDGRQREAGLGSVGAVGLADARKAAAKVRQDIANGVDPLAHRTPAAAAPITFAQAADEYIAAHESGWRNAVHRDQWRTTLVTYAHPVIGSKPVNDVSTEDVMSILRPLWTAKTETASRVRGRIEAILDSATVRGWRSGPNPAAWKGHLAHLLPARSKVRPVRHHTALPWQALPAFMFALGRHRKSTAALAVAFLILTAARSSEARGATWAEIDLTAKVWTVPPERMKALREHRVPLSAAALEVLHRAGEARTDASPTAYVFPGGTKAGRTLSDVACSKMIRQSGGGEATLHGFRSTFREWAAETGQPGDLAEAALAHTLGDKTVQAYLRGTMFDRRRALMDAWAVYATGPAAELERLLA